MRVLKIVGYIVVIFLFLWVIVAFLSPKEIKTTQSITINTTPYVVFDQVNNLEQWNNWSPWIMRDPDMEQELSENSIGIGAIVRWKSESEGNGEQSIIESSAPEKIRTSLVFDDWDGITYSNWTFKKAGENTTKVTWNLEGSVLPFFIRPLGFSWNADIKNDYKAGLINLKAVCESIPQKNENLRVKIVETEPIIYIGKRINVNTSEIGPAIGKAYKEIIDFLSAKGLEISGKPFSIYYDSESVDFDILVALPVVNEIESNADFESGILPAGHAAMISHFGNYTNLPATYHIIRDWVKDGNYQITGNSWEVYVNDPTNEPDSSKWETRIYFPVKK